MRLRFALLSLALPLAAAAAPPDTQWLPAPGALQKSTLPAHLRGLADLPDGSVTPLRRDPAKADATWRVVLPDGEVFTLSAPSETHHANGDVTYAGVPDGSGADHAVVMTVGRDASFATWNVPGGSYRFERWRDQAWLIDTRHPGLHAMALQDDAVHVPHAAKTVGNDAAKATGTTIDTLFLHTPSFAARYPGDAATTRIRHLVAVANQVFANSRANVALRVVGIDQVGYLETNSNGGALEHMRSATAGNTMVGLETLAARREATGADLVTMIRPHDVETRGSCGIAYLFTGDRREGFNVVSDGFDSWSLCDDLVYAHEVGHNLGAEHQVGASSENAGFGTAFIAPGKFHTVMGSFGSGDPDRNRTLMTFSSPELFCGGIRCGIPNVADNARRVRDTMQAVAGFQASTVPGAAELAVPLDADSDGDGVNDSADAFPFDPAAQSDRDDDGVADDDDAFPDDAAESADRDSDGLGDNADPDRDGDGVPNAQDALPDDPAGSVDSDGDRVADNVDVAPQDGRESRDTDGDGLGDNADPDADGDGAADVAPGAALADHDLLVALRDSVVRLDGRSGLYGGVEFAGTHRPQVFGPRAVLAWDAMQKRVLALAASDVRRYARHDGALERILLESWAGSPNPGLASGLPQGMALDAAGVLYVGDTASLELRRFDAVTGALLRGGVFGPHVGGEGFFADDPRALAVVGRRLFTLDRGGAMAEVDLDTLALLRRFTPTTNFAAPSNAAAMVASPDGGALFVAETSRNRVVRIDPAQPAAGAVFVAAGSGGLSAPSGLVFGPDGHLYVSSAGTGQVLRYDGATGAFVDVFSRVPAGAMTAPRALLFVPKVVDRHPLDAARRVRPIAGGWSDPSRAGEGIDLQAIGDSLAMTWYTFDRNGIPTWYLAVGPLAGNVFAAPLQVTRWNGSQATASAVGNVRLTFAAEDRLRFEATLNHDPQESPLLADVTMQPVAAGTSSETQFPTAAWFDAGEPGWGITVTRQGEITYAVAFVYDAAGRPTWTIGGGPNGETLSMVIPACTHCPGTIPPQLVLSAGTLDFAPIDSDRAVLDLRLDQSAQDWVRDIEAVRATDSPTLPDGRRTP